VVENTCVRAVLESERSACLKLLDLAFEWAENGYFVRYFEGDPWYKDHYCRVYTHEGRIVSALNICRREVRVGRARLIMGGIANVGTDPEHRRKGYSSEVMRDSIRVMESEEMDFSLLYTGRYGFYGRLGWRVVDPPYLAGRLRALEASAGEDKYHIRLYDEQRDAARLLSIYDQFNAERALTVARTESLWRNFSLHKYRSPWTIALAEVGAGPVAYTLSLVKEKTLQFHEVGFASGHQSALGVLMRRAAVEALGQGVEEVTIEPAGDVSVIAEATRIAEDLQTKPGLHAMLLFFNPRRMLTRLLPELDTRVLEAGLRGSAAIETEVGCAGLISDGSKVEVVEPSDSMPRARLTQPDLARLVFGMGPISDADSEVCEEAKEFLSRLFPRQPCVYWEADKF